MNLFYELRKFLTVPFTTKNETVRLPAHQSDARRRDATRYRFDRHFMLIPKQIIHTSAHWGDSTLRNVARRCATQAMQLWSCYFLPKKIGTPPTEAAASDAKQQKCLWQRGFPVFPTRYRLTPRPLKQHGAMLHRATQAMLGNRGDASDTGRLAAVSTFNFKVHCFFICDHQLFGNMSDQVTTPCPRKRMVLGIKFTEKRLKWLQPFSNQTFLTRLFAFPGL